jgi:hypothetical protein
MPHSMTRNTLTLSDQHPAHNEEPVYPEVLFLISSYPEGEQPLLAPAWLSTGYEAGTLKGRDDCLSVFIDKVPSPSFSVILCPKR